MTINPTTTHLDNTGDNTGDNRVVVGLSSGPADTEDVLIAYLVGVEALRAGKEAVMFLTKDAVRLAVDGRIDGGAVDHPGAPSIADLHREYVEAGGRFFVCPVCVKLRGLEAAAWTKNAEVKGVPSVWEFAQGGALVWNV